MNRRFLNASLAALAACLFANCASTTQSRIEANPAMYSALTEKHKQAVNSGQLLQGMGKDAVYLAWGRPSGIKEGNLGGRAVEKWRYVGHRQVVSNYFNFGYGYGRYCDSGLYDYGHTVDYIPYTAAVVEFHGGKVSGWERERP